MRIMPDHSFFGLTSQGNRMEFAIGSGVYHFSKWDELSIIEPPV